MTKNLIRSAYDICVYLKKGLSGSIAYLQFYVDDMLTAAKDKEELINIKAQFCEEFEMKDLDTVKKTLGMKILWDRKADKLYLSQKEVIENVLYRFNMLNAKVVNTPLDVHF